MSITKEQALSKAKIALMSRTDAVFVSTIILSMQSTFTDTIPTACTNGVDLWLNEDFYMGLNPLEQVGLLAHEAWHVALQHTLADRVKGRDMGVFNQAADHVINLMLLDAGYRLPKGGLWDKAYAGMSTEQVYDILIKDKTKQDPNFIPDFQIGNASNDPAANKAVHDQVMDTIIRAGTQARAAGDTSAGALGGEVQIALEELLYPKLPWNQILENFLNGLGHEDYSYTRPNKRYLPDDIYLPTLYSEGMGTLACAVDTSGSVSNHDFMAFVTEMECIRENMKPESMYVIDFDTRINNVHLITENNSLRQMQFTGRGGTSLHPVFEHFEKIPPQVLVVFSDLECSPVEKNPGYPVIWIRTPGHGHTPEFGKLIEFDPS